MSWKTYKQKFKLNKPDETQFILGIDLGDHSSCIAYYDVYRGHAEVIDLSGGYGKPTIPTVVQHIPENREWVFGEYAAINRGFDNAVTLSSIVDRLGQSEYFEIDNRPVSCSHILSLFLKELIASCKNINPKAEIAGICVAVASYMPKSAKDELLAAFKLAGYEGSVISLLPERDCTINYYLHNTQIRARENVLVLDYGGRELRGGVYEIAREGSKTTCVSLSSLFDEALGTNAVDARLNRLLAGFYAEQTGAKKPDAKTKETLLAFSYQHKDLLFQRGLGEKPPKLYYNFVYPPFVQIVTQNHLKEIIDPFESGFRQFVKLAVASCVNAKGENCNLSFSSIDRVICTGGGFEMLWAKECVNGMFKSGIVEHSKNPKCVPAKGAAVVAAAKLSLLDENTLIETHDPHRLTCDIGVNVKNDRFVPIVEKGSLWWQTHEPKTFILTEATAGPVCVLFYKREANGVPSPLERVEIDGLPARPKGVTRLCMRLSFQSHTAATATITDAGFGEMFPASDYLKTVDIRL